MVIFPHSRAAVRSRLFASLFVVSIAVVGCGRTNMVAPDPQTLRATQPLHRDRYTDQAIHLEGRVPSGAIWVIDKPADWNHALVVYVHGYTNPSDPVALPHNEAIRDSLVARGYAVAASSFSSNGFAVPEGVRESDALREIFAEQVGDPRRTYLFGQSLGGLIGLLLAQEGADEHYDGAFLVCGIVGTSTEEVQYIGDIRVLFDAVYPGVLPGDLEHSPVITDVNRQIVGPVVTAVSKNPQGLGIIQLLARHPLAGNNSQELVASLINALGFSVQGGSDLFARTNSQSFFDNASWTYASGTLPPALVADINARVARFTRTREAEQFLRRFGEPSPRLRVPLMSLHTSRDPVVPAWHEDRLRQVVTSPLLVQRMVDRYGHCTFSAGELMVHFNDLVNFANDAERAKGREDERGSGGEVAVQTVGGQAGRDR